MKLIFQLIYVTLFFISFVRCDGETIDQRLCLSNQIGFDYI